jgi:uncharacterized coiled-coil DUF342 family protein
MKLDGWRKMEETKKLINGLKNYVKELCDKHQSNNPAIKALKEKIKELEDTVECL